MVRTTLTIELYTLWKYIKISNGIIYDDFKFTFIRIKGLSCVIGNTMEIYEDMSYLNHKPVKVFKLRTS